MVRFLRTQSKDPQLLVAGNKDLTVRHQLLHERAEVGVDQLRAILAPRMGIDCSRRSNRLGYVGRLRDYIPSFSSVKMGDEWGSLALEWRRRDKI